MQEQPSILRHRLAPAVLSLWFGALFGLSVLAIQGAMLERAVLWSGLDHFLPAANPPLGAKARLLLALALGVAGALTGLFVAHGLARKSRRAQSEDNGAGRKAHHARRRGRDAHPDAPARTPIMAHEELGEDGFDMSFENASFEKVGFEPGPHHEALLAAKPFAKDDGFPLASPPPVHDENGFWQDSPWASEKAHQPSHPSAFAPPPHEDFGGAGDYGEAGTARGTIDWTPPAWREPTSSELPSTLSLRGETPAEHYAGMAHEALARMGEASPEPRFLTRESAAILPHPAMRLDREAETASVPLDQPMDLPMDLPLDLNAFELADETPAAARVSAADKITTTPLDSMSHVELIERLAIAMQRRREREDAKAAARAEARAEETPDDAPSPAPESTAQSEGTSSPFDGTNPFTGPNPFTGIGGNVTSLAGRPGANDLQDTHEFADRGQVIASIHAMRADPEEDTETNLRAALASLRELK